MIQYHEDLGWRLTPSWKGRHTHHDFDVRYSVNSYGFRGCPATPAKSNSSMFAVVGDSFTFGLGVNDEETFVCLLNTRKPGSNTYLNFGIPGFSTDQELLLIKEWVFPFAPDRILLVVYLGNDLFDNQLPFPLQADHAKPYFELTPDGLILKNAPVPLKIKPAALAKNNLRTAVLGDEDHANSTAARLLSRFELLRLFEINFFSKPDVTQFDARFDYPLRLFFAIIGNIRDLCIKNSVELSILLMPGKSFVQSPDSPSAEFQDFLRKKVVAGGKMMNIEVIDLAEQLRSRFKAKPGRWFYPNEGHMTPEGHRMAADILSSILS